MKKLLIFGLVTLLLFGSSAAFSWYLNERKSLMVKPQAAQTTIPSTAPERKAGQMLPAADEAPALGGQRSMARPSYSAGAEEAIQLATSLRERLSAVREKEGQLAQRQKSLELIYEDIAGERNAIDELRNQLSDELKAVEARLDSVEKRAADSEQQRNDASTKLTQMKKELTQLEGVEQTNIKKMAEMYDSMDPESAARILEQLANSAKMDTAVKLLGEMKERQAAKVLAALPPDSGLAPQLLEKLKGFRKSTSDAGK
jgi:flagellar motility protein MotE (MotC chaperone)